MPDRSLHSHLVQSRATEKSPFNISIQYQTQKQKAQTDKGIVNKDIKE